MMEFDNFNKYDEQSDDAPKRRRRKRVVVKKAERVQPGGYNQRQGSQERFSGNSDSSSERPVILPNRREGYNRPERGGYGDQQRGGYGGQQRGSYGDQQRGGYGGQQRGGYGGQQRGSYGDQQRGGYGSQQRGGYGSQQRGGYGSQQRGGYGDQQRGGYGDQQRGGYGDQQRGGYGSQQRGGYGGQQRGGYGGQQRSSYGGQQRSSYGGQQRGGYGGQQRGGYGGQQRGGYGGQQRGGYGGQQRGGYGYKQREEISTPVKFDFTLEEPMRLNRFLANAGICSRRDADKFIQEGLVKINNEVVTELGVKVNPTDVVSYKEKEITPEKKVYIVMNKPKNYVTTMEDPNAKQTVIDLLGQGVKERVFPVGRLDKNTTGVLLLTNDGDLAANLTHPKFNKKKVYHVSLDKPLAKNDMIVLAEGFELEDGFIAADALGFPEHDDKKQVGVEIHSGRNRIVRRMFGHLGYSVVKLDRVYFAGLTKKKMKRGKWRYLSPKEVGYLKMGSQD